MEENPKEEGVTIVTTQAPNGKTQKFIIPKIVLDTRAYLDKNEFEDYQITLTEHRKGKILK